MLRLLCGCAGLAACLSASAARAAEPPPPAPAEPRLVAYFAEWSIYQRNYHVADVPADRITHINYAFAQIRNGECALFDSFAAVDKAYPGDTWDQGVLRGSFNQLIRLKKKHPHLKTLI